MSVEPILPGATIGVLGSGQLGRMFAIAARRMGYRVHTFSPDYDTPTGQVADVEVVAPLRRSRRARARSRAASMSSPSSSRTSRPHDRCRRRAIAPVRPSGAGAAHRAAARCARRRSSPITASRSRRSPRSATPDDLRRRAASRRARPAVLKTAGFGYDGKGQVAVDRTTEAARAPGTRSAAQEAVLERVRRLRARGLGHRGARRSTARGRTYGADREPHAITSSTSSVAPAAVPPAVATAAPAIARGILEALDVRRRAVRRVLRDRATASCWSTSWRRARTTPAT